VSDFRPANWTGGPNPDIQAVGWVTDRPGATVRRRRSPFLLGLGVLLGLAAAVGSAVSIVDLVRTSGFDQEDVVAEGVVAALGDEGGGEPATFTAGGADPFTIWIQTDGIDESNERENVIAATACAADLAGGGRPDFQGNRQGSAVTIEDDSTVGWFTAAEGEVTVRCHQEPFGQARTRGWLEDEHGFVVARGKPAAPWGSFAVLSGAIVLLLLAIAVLTRWGRGRLVPA